MKIEQQERDALMAKRAKRNGIAFSLFTLFLSFFFLAAVPVAMRVTNTDATTMWQNLFRICTSPSKLVTDYFGVGCLSSTLLNAGLCGLACNFLILIKNQGFFPANLSYTNGLGDLHHLLARRPTNIL